jgi:AraC-like DNA-binding protein
MLSPHTRPGPSTPLGMTRILSPMPYREIAPSDALAAWVDCFWTSRDDEGTGEHRVLPDGCADLIFDLHEGEGLAVGTMTRPLLVPERPNTELFGVRFRPGRAAAFLRIPLAEITDARVPLGNLWREDATGEVVDADSMLDRIAILERELLRRVERRRDDRVDGAIARIVARGGKERVDDIAREIGISRQHLARQFLQHVGVSPKTFARVVRFNRLLGSAGAEAGWADVALEHGYYDQSHLIAEFRELAGTTPGSFHFSNR